LDFSESTTLTIAEQALNDPEKKSARGMPHTIIWVKNALEDVITKMNPIVNIIRIIIGFFNVDEIITRGSKI
jgi:hypothetical protein